MMYPSKWDKSKLDADFVKAFKKMGDYHENAFAIAHRTDIY